MTRTIRQTGRDDAVRPWFDEYRRLVAVEVFYETYRTRCARRGRRRRQNFFSGSELLRTDEVRWCKVLRWLLDPETGAAAAEQLQQSLLEKAGLKVSGLLTAVEREVRENDGNRLDIVLRGRKRMVVIEAKVYAPVDLDQLKRYAQDKEQFSGVLVTLKHEKSLPGGWSSVTWSDIAEALDSVAGELPEASAGAVAVERWRVVALDFAALIRNPDGAEEGL